MNPKEPMYTVDQLLQKTLIDWAFNDVQHPVKKDALIRMHAENWEQQLYAENDSMPLIKEENPTVILQQNRAAEHPQWLKTLVKKIAFETRKMYADNFETDEWDMDIVSTSKSFKFGPINHHKQIFFQFIVHYKDGFLFWDIRTNFSKVNPKHFPQFSQIIRQIVYSEGLDFVIKKSAKVMGRFNYTNEKSKQLCNLIQEMKNHQVLIGNDAHGNVFIMKNKKKVFKLEPTSQNGKALFAVLDKESHDLLCYLKDVNDIKKLLATHDVRTEPRKTKN